MSDNLIMQKSGREQNLTVIEKHFPEKGIIELMKIVTKFSTHLKNNKRSNNFTVKLKFKKSGKR